MQDYKNLKVWKRGHTLVLLIYKLTQDFPKDETFGLINQLKRSVVSVPANIAEGAGRKTQNDFAHFLNIALGSLNESSYYILLSKDLQYIDEKNYNNLDKEINEVKAMLIALINSVRRK